MTIHLPSNANQSLKFLSRRKAKLAFETKKDILYFGFYLWIIIFIYLIFRSAVGLRLCIEWVKRKKIYKTIFCG